MMPGVRETFSPGKSLIELLADLVSVTHALEEISRIKTQMKNAMEVRPCAI